MAQHWSRRQFIGATASTIMASCANVRAPVGARSERVAVLVVGAGLAGLAAAHELTRRGDDVLVVEARVRPGGRVLTLRDPFDDGLRAEAGAMYVGRGDELVRRYVSELGLAFVSSTPAPHVSSIYHLRDQRIVVPKGAEVAWPFALTHEERAAGFAGLWKQHVRSLVDRYVTAVKAATVERLDAELDVMSFAEALRRGGASGAAIDMFRTSYLEAFGDGFDSVSAHAVVRELARPRLASKPSGGFDRIEGGSDRLPKALAAKLGARVRYATRLDRIEQHLDCVIVTVEGPAGSSQIIADRVIVAVPARVLSGIGGSGISDQRRRQLRALGSTSVMRVFFQCRRRFWEERSEAGAASTDRGARWIIDDTGAQPGTRGIISAYATANTARRLAELGEAERVKEAADDVSAVHVGLEENLERSVSYCWDTDRFAQGAHSAPAPGQLSLVRKMVSPEGRIYFAGEYLSEAPGWMEGALASGLSAARALA
jgi:monoamine oxidase